MQRTLLSKAPFRGRMVTGIALCFLWLAAVQLLNLYVVWTTDGRSATTVAADANAQSQLAALSIKASQVQAIVLTEWYSPSRETTDQSRAVSERLDREITAAAESLRRAMTRPEELVALEDFQFAWSQYVKARESAGSPQGTAAFPQTLLDAGNMALERLRGLQATAAGGAQLRVQQANEQRARSKVTMLVMSILATIPALLLGIYVVSELSQATDMLARVAQLVATGDTEVGGRGEAGNELDSLGEALNRMIRTSKRIASARREASEQLERDMRERRVVEAALAAERRRYDSLLRLLGDAVVTTDANGRVIGLNRSAERLTGWSHRDALGKPVSEVIQLQANQSSPTGAPSAPRTLTSGITTLRGDRLTLLTRAGAGRSITRHSTPLHDADDRVVGTLVVLHETQPEGQEAR